MTLDLGRMLHESAAAAPPDGLDTAALLRAGRRRVRHRRAVRLAGASATVALVLLAPLAWSRLGAGGPAPAGPVQPVGPVVHLAAAQDAASGRDYTVLTRLRSGDLDRRNGVALGPLLPDGRVLVQDGPHGPRNASRWGVLDPRTDRTRWLPRLDREDTPDTFVGTDAGRLVLSADRYDGRTVVLWLADPASGTWRRRVLDITGTGERPAGAVATMVGAAAVDAGRLYFTLLTPGHATYRTRLWSTDLATASEVRDEGVDVGTFDVADGRLVYMSSGNRPTSRMHVRDLATGSEQTVDTRSGRRCNQLGLRLTQRTVVLSQFCGTRDRVRDDRVQVVTLTGDPVVTLQDDSLDLGAADGRMLTVVSMRDGRAGTYVYDLDTRRLLRLSHGFSRFGGGDGLRGSRLMWSTPTLHGSGREMWVADLR
jgi:hypothetical protein